MAEMRIAEPERRDRLLLISAFAMVLLTMLGAAGESLGMDGLLKPNTSKTRTHSLFRQGCMLYELIPNIPEHRLLPLMQRFIECWSVVGCLADWKPSLPCACRNCASYASSGVEAMQWIIRLATICRKATISTRRKRTKPRLPFDEFPSVRDRHFQL